MVPRYLYAVCMKKTGQICRSFPAWRPALYTHKRDAKDDCPIYAEVVTYKAVKLPGEGR